MPSPNSLANLKPFPPHNKANLSGRPDVDKEFRLLCQAFVAAPTLGGFALIVEMARDKGNPNQFNALKTLIEYAHGKPMQPVTLKGDPDAPVSFEIIVRRPLEVFPT